MINNFVFFTNKRKTAKLKFAYFEHNLWNFKYLQGRFFKKYYKFVKRKIKTLKDKIL